MCSLNIHCVKSVQIRSIFWPVFSCIRTRKNSVFGHFSRSDLGVNRLLKKEAYKKAAAVFSNSDQDAIC